MRKLLAALAVVNALGLALAAPAHAERPSLGECPSWKTQYDQLIDASTNENVLTARHRGSFSEKLPENSLGAFGAAFDECRPAVETDIRMTGDGQTVVFHDTRIGKMLEPGHDPEANVGQNAALSTLTMAELKSKRLLTPDRKASEYSVPTLEELIDFTLDKDAPSIVHLEVKEAAALLPTLRLLARKSEERPSQDVLKRFVVKFLMSEYPTPEHFRASMQAQGLPTGFLLMPKINSGDAQKLNSLAPLPDPEELELSTNASRAVAHWSAAPMELAPVVEVNIKDSSEFLRTEKELGSRFGYFDRPVSYALDDVRRGTVAEFVALVHHYGTKLGAFVPVPDYVMFTSGPAAGFTVPNTFGDHTPIPVTDAFFNNTSSCCYRLQDRKAPSPIAAERNDWRGNLDFLRSIGANVLTADDTDSIDLYALEQGYLNTVARPSPVPPPRAMNSSLYYAIRNLAVPDRALVRIQGWNGGSSPAWGGQVCLWTNPNGALWTVKCDYTDQPFSNELQVETVDGGKMRIRDPKSLHCIYSDPAVDDRVLWREDCNSPRALWTRSAEHRFSDADGREINFQWDDRYSYGHPFAYNYLSTKDTSSWSRWKLVPVT